MKSVIILFVCFYAVSGQTKPSNTFEDQLKTLQSIEHTKWAEIKALIEVQDRRFDQFEKMIEAMDRRFDRNTCANTDGRPREVGFSGSDRSSKVTEDEDPIDGMLDMMTSSSVCANSWAPFRREKCYKYYGESKTYAEAVDHCKRQGNNATLASIRNADEQAFVDNYLFTENRPNDNVWLGVKRNPQDRSLVWEDGSRERYTNWDVADNFVAGNDCVEIQRETPTARDRRQGMWLSSQCRARNLILCSYAPKQSTRPQTKPTGNRPVTELGCIRSRPHEVGANGDEPQISGGITVADPMSAEILTEAEFAVNTIAQKTNSRYVHKVGKVINARSQVVAGFKYYLVIEMHETSCRAGRQVVNVGNCAVTATQICEAEVVTQSWMKPPRQLLSHRCAPILC